MTQQYKKPHFVTFLWNNPEAKHKGTFEYDINHVLKLYNSLRRHFRGEFEFTLVTDDQSGVHTPFRKVLLWDHIPIYRCYPRLALFSKEIGLQYFGNSIVHIDLDILITGDITEMIHEMQRYDFVAYQDKPNPGQYSCSFMHFNPERVHMVWDTFQPVKALDESLVKWIGSDQGWVNSFFGGVAHPLFGDRVGLWCDVTYPHEDAVFDFFELDGKELPENTRMVMFNGMQYDMSMKDLQERNPWILENWR